MNETETIKTEEQPVLVVAGIPMTQEEYTSAQKNVRRTSRLLAIAWPVTLVFLAFILLALTAQSSTETRLLSSFGWLVFAAILTVVTAILRHNKEKQAFLNAYGGYRAMRGDALDQVRFYSDHVECISERRRLAVPYTELVEFYEDAQKFVLYADGVLVVLPARGLTPQQAQGIYVTVTAGLPEGHIVCKQRLCPMLTEPVPVPDYPDRPVTPPKAFNQPPRNLEEHRQRTIIGMQVSLIRTPFAVLAGLFTGLLIDPADIFYAADGLCIVVWLLLSQLAINLFAIAAAQKSKPNVLGISPATGGITVYIKYGEMFVPYEMLVARDAGDGLMVQTPLEPVYLRYADMEYPETIKRYFGL